MTPDCFDPPLLPSRALPWVQFAISAHPHRNAVIFVSVLALAILAFEILALLLGFPTISQWTQAASRSHPWVRWAGTIGGILLIFHLFWKGPLW